MIKNQTNTPNVISHVHQLVSIILLFSILIISVILWQIHEHNKLNDISKNYYNASIQHINHIQIEVLKLKNILSTLASIDNDKSKQSYLQKTHSEITQYLYVIKQYNARILAIQTLYQDNNLLIIVKQLQSRLAPILALLDSNLSTDNLSDSIRNINAIQLTLEQFDRLHKIVNTELNEKKANQEETRSISLIALFFIFLLTSAYITTKTSRSIHLILKKQKLTEDILSTEKKLSHTTLNSIGDAVITTDNNGIVTNLNPVAERLTGWSNEQAIGLTLNTIFPIINASTREPIENPVDKVLKTGEIVYLSNHTTLISKDGTEHQIADSAAPIRDEDEILGMVLVFNDVTEQYLMREKVHSTVQHLKLYREQAPLASIEWNTDFQIIDWNLAAEKMFGYKLEEVKGRDFVDIMLPESALVDVEQIWEDLISQTGGEVSINENLTKEGKTILCEWHNTPLVNESGTVIGASSIVQDITERKIQEEQLRRSQKMDALGKLTGGVAHDYNNMLGVIMGFSELLIDQLSDQPKLRKFAHEIYRAAERGAKLTSKLLNFSRQQATDQEKLDLNILLNNAYNMLEKSLTARIKLTLDLQDNLWPVYLDQGELEDAILNICINAMHSIEGNGKISIQTRNEVINNADSQLLQLETGEYVLLSITDNGSGMSKDVTEKIFDPFFSTKGDQGTGLGLSQVYGFMERSKGAVKLYSEPGYGSRFILFFPRSNEFNDINSQCEKNSNLDTTGNETILVVDDELSLLSLTNEILSQQGYQVHCTDNAKQALDILQHYSIDLLLSDIIMPDMDGYQLASIVREKYPHIKIQLASGFADERNADLVDDDLQQNLLRKPFNSQLLLEQIRILLDQ